MPAPLPRGVSALCDPLDEPYLALLVMCAAIRRDLGLVALSHADLERALDEPHTPAPAAHKVVLLDVARRRRAARHSRRLG
ncbi:MAG: hypothetical protein JOZ24_13405 [Candidatus Eremiobacteraeota bacterium]|nr:hypothetical protein [Candidatus Eremiobacteraeota bacterium]